MKTLALICIIIALGYIYVKKGGYKKLLKDKMNEEQQKAERRCGKQE